MKEPACKGVYTVEKMFTQEPDSNLQSDLESAFSAINMHNPTSMWKYLTTYAPAWQVILAVICGIGLVCAVVGLLMFVYLWIKESEAEKAAGKPAKGSKSGSNTAVENEEMTLPYRILQRLIIVGLCGLALFAVLWISYGGKMIVGSSVESAVDYRIRMQNEVANTYVNQVVGFEDLPILSVKKEADGVYVKVKTIREQDELKVLGNISDIIPGKTMVQARWIPAVSPKNPPKWDNVTLVTKGM